MKDPLERERLARVFEKGLETAVGTVLPHPARAQRPRPLAQRAVVPALGEVLPDPRRFAARLPPAARSRCRGRAGGHRTSSAEPDPMVSHPNLPPLEAFRRAPVLRRQERRGVPEDTNGDGEARREALAPGTGARSRHASRRRPFGRQHRAHRHGLRAARRPSLRLHAADRAHRGLSRPRHRGRGHRRGTRPAGLHRRLSAARPDPRLMSFQRHARPRRHRGQHPSLDELARARRQDRDRLRGGARRRGWARRNS